MEPKKARLAITVTVVVTILIVALCLFLLLSPTPALGGGSKNTTGTVSASEVVLQQPEVKEEEQQPDEGDPAFAWFVWTKPNADDLKGCAEEMQRPKLSSYLDYYEIMVVNPEFVNEKEDEEIEFAYLLYEPTKKLYSRHVILELPTGTPVLALAKENGYTLVLVQEGVGGWVRTDLLDYLG